MKQAFRAVVRLALCAILLHSTLLWVRMALNSAARDRVGYVSLDSQGRGRHYRPDPEGRGVQLLSGDAVEPGGIRPLDRESFRDEFGVSMPAELRGRRLIHERGLERGLPYLVAQIAPDHETRMWLRDEARFGELGESPGVAVFSFQWRVSDHDVRGLVLERSGARLARVTVDPAKLIERNVADAVRVDRIELDPPVRPAEIRAEYGRDAVWTAIVGNEFWVFGDDATVRERQTLPVDFRDVMDLKVAGSQRVYVALTGPVRPDGYDVSVMVLEPGHEPIARRISIVPTTPDQKRIVTGLAIASAFRPPVLNMAAMATQAPPTFVGLVARYWLDPLFAEGAHAGWAFASLLVALCCAGWVFVQARRRCPKSRDVAFWTFAALLLGPTGALWMRISIPWVAIEDGRAVNLESPEWPLPARTGTEVFDSGAANPVDAAPLPVE